MFACSFEGKWQSFVHFLKTYDQFSFLLVDTMSNNILNLKLLTTSCFPLRDSDFTNRLLAKFNNA